METYFCYNTNGKIIGSVTAPTGDLAWFLARYAQPEVAYIRPEQGAPEEIAAWFTR